MDAYVDARERRRMPRIRERYGPSELRIDHGHMGRVEIDADLCTGCKLCVRTCPAKALEMTGPRAVAMVGAYAACIACSDCVAICDTDAVKLIRPLSYDGYYKTIGRGELSAPRTF